MAYMATSKASTKRRRARKTFRSTGLRLRRRYGYNFSRALTYQKNELKAFDFNATANINGSNISVINAMQQGTEAFQRIGRQIYMQSIQVDILLYNVATTLEDWIRIALVYDSQTNAATPALIDIFANNNGASSNAMSNVNMNNRERFTILKYWKFKSPSVTNTGGAGVLTNGPAWAEASQGNFRPSCFIKLKGLSTTFNGNNVGNTTGDITSGSLLLVSQNLFSTDNGSWTAQIQTRVRFYD